MMHRCRVNKPTVYKVVQMSLTLFLTALCCLGVKSCFLLPSLSQSMVLLLHSQHQYIFDYDSGDRLSAVTMPSVARHTMQTIRSIGYYRNIYTPPESNASVTVDYSEDGQVCVCNKTANYIKAHDSYHIAS